MIKIDHGGADMTSFQDAMDEYRQQLAKGVLQQAYRGLMAYLLELKTHFKDKYPAYSVSGSLYYGTMDMTYFALTPESLKKRGLKIAVVFLHEACRFEVWLAGYNRPLQAEYWRLFKESGWEKYPLVPTTRGVDAILVHTLAGEPNFGDLAGLTAQIEDGTLRFIADIEAFLLVH
jgi:hypothetical protein